MNKAFLGLLCFTSGVFAEAPAAKKIDAWMTGPLLCPAYGCVPQGSYNIEPYLYATINYATYNPNWHAVSQSNFIQAYNYTLIQIGITNWFNVSLSPQFYYQSQKRYSSANIGDIPLELYFALLQENLDGIRPGFLIGLKANAPIGRYKNLTPNSGPVEAIGAGSWRPALSFVVGKQIHFNDVHFLTVRAYFSPQFRNKFRVTGFNAYGGGYGTSGTVSMGTQYTAIASLEYSFSRHGVFAFDFQYQHNNKITFKGKNGYADLARTTPASVGLPSSEQFSIAPALEYNFNNNVGVIGGVWFSIAGRNADAFITPTFALNVEY